MDDWTDAERRAVASQVGLPYGWTARVKALPDGRALVTALAARNGEPLPCGHRSVHATARTPTLAVALLARWVRFHRETCAE